MNLKHSVFNSNKEDALRIPYDSDDVKKLIALQLSPLLPTIKQPIIVFCIGTDRSTGDSLGPLVGTFLKELNTTHFQVYGTLDDPIHAVNLVERLAEIKNNYHNPFIIGIDACLGRLRSVGMITIGKGPIKPGAGVNKELTPVGDIHMTGIVNVSGFMEYFVLQNTRLSLVMKMAQAIANGLYEAEVGLVRKAEISNYKIDKSLPK